MGRADDPGVDRDRLARTDPLDHPLLQEAQQFNLQGQRDITHLVKEQRPAIGDFDLAFGGFDGPGEGALLMPEQLAFEQVFRDRGAIDRHEGPARAVARVMQPAREEFLAGAARAEQHDRDIGVGNALDRARDLDHFGGRGDHSAEHAVVFAAACGKLAVLVFDLLQPQRASHDQSQRLDIDRFLVKIVGPLRDRLQRRAPRAVARGDNHFGVGLERHDRIEHRETFAGPVGIAR